MWILAGDIGGTRTRLQLAQRREGGWQNLSSVEYASADYAHLSDIVRAHLQQHHLDQLAAACFAVAGPVQKQTARITNLPWVLESGAMQAQLHIQHVALVNDFTAVAHGLSQLSEMDTVILQQGIPVMDGAIAILGAGTGLGQAIAKPFDKRLVVIDGEGGHVDFAPRTAEEVALLQYWLQRLERVSYETFLSGKGLARIFEFISQHEVIDAALVQALQQQDPAAAISEFALHKNDPLASRALRCFANIYAAQAANLALVAKATGGVYLAGGIAPKIIAYLQEEEFLQVFNAKAPMQHLLATIPVQVIVNTRVGLLGALQIAKQLII